MLSSLFVSLLLVSLLALLTILLNLNMSGKSREATKEVMPASESTWEAFKSTRLDLHLQFDWNWCRIPRELQNNDAESDLPEKLKQILAWSLILNPAQSTTCPGQETSRQKADEGDLHVIQGEVSGKMEHTTPESTGSLALCKRHGSESTTADNRKHVNSNTTRNASDAHSINSEQSSETRRSRPRSISNSVFGSTRDLIVALKSKAAKESVSITTANQHLQNKRPMVECTGCLEDTIKTGTTKLPCNHSYCKPCLTLLVTTALQNESSFPPKCCLTLIPLQTVLASLDAKQRDAYKEKAAEYSVPSQDRWYCPNSKCSKWIRPSKLFRIPAFNERCPHCATRICTICRGMAHKSSTDCPQDFGLEA